MAKSELAVKFSINHKKACMCCFAPKYLLALIVHQLENVLFFIAN